MKRYIQTALLAAALMGTATAFAGNVQTDYNHTADFSQYKTYSWGKVKTTDPFFVTRVQNAVNQQLQAKGWTLAPTGGSVTVFATDNIHDQQEIQTMYDGLGGGWGPGFGSGVATTTTTDQNVGNLVIDLFEGSSKQILWRGLATENLSSNDVRNTKQLDQDIAKMFKSFPPKPGK
jgi:nicotinic acid phosphoribosyltransferase